MPVKPAGLLLLLSSSALAVATEDAMPSMDFLEFLGEWEAEDGAWIDSQMQATTGEEPSAREVREDD